MGFLLCSWASLKVSEDSRVSCRLVISLQGFKDGQDLGIIWPVDSVWGEQSEARLHYGCSSGYLHGPGWDTIFLKPNL